MKDDQNMTSAEQTARDALEAHALEGNMKAVAVLAESANPQQQAEHIRGVVATMAHYSSEATAATQAHASQWRAWALSLIEKLDAPAAQLAGEAPRA